MTFKNYINLKTIINVMNDISEEQNMINRKLLFADIISHQFCYSEYYAMDLH